MQRILMFETNILKIGYVNMQMLLCVNLLIIRDSQLNDFAYLKKEIPQRYSISKCIHTHGYYAVAC